MRALAVLLLAASSLTAHAGEPLQPHDVWSAWSWDPLIVAGLVLSGWLYARGARRERGVQSWEMICYWAGWLTLAAALLSPIHAVGEVLFSAHMAQHELIMAAAAPLLVSGRPLVPYLWALPESMRRDLGRWSKRPSFARSWSFVSQPANAWWIHFVALWGWHLPRFFQATISSALVHAGQHLSFLLSALLFWWALFRRHGTHGQHGAGAFYVFTTMVHNGVLGALLTFSTVVWYPAYSNTTESWGLTALEDQQLGGLIMTVPPIAVYLAAFLYLFARWIRESGAGARVTTLALACMLSGCGPNPEFQAYELVPGGDANRGKAHIEHYGCGSCHDIPGVAGAEGNVGPPLTKVARRTYLAGRITNTPDNMKRWILDPKSVDEKTAMPKAGLSPAEAEDVVRYLYTLK